MSRFFFAFVLLLTSTPAALTQDAHDHGADDHSPAARQVTKPRIFLDKSARVVEYQLKRLNDAQLLLVDRELDDPKYIPVYAAILSRPSIPPATKAEAAEGLAVLRKTSVAEELMTAIGSIPEDRRRDAAELIRLLLRQSADGLQSSRSTFVDGVTAAGRWQRAASAAALTIAGTGAADHPAAPADWLLGVSLIPDPAIRDAQANRVIGYLDPAGGTPTRRQAIRTLATLRTDAVRHARRLAGMIGEAELRSDLVAALLRLPVEQLPPAVAADLAETLVVVAEQTKPSERTSDAFLRSVELSEQAMKALPAETAKALRSRLREVAVRLVRIGTVEEEMRYDVRYFAVEAGRDVQVILDNHDLMPHNFVVTTPGKLKEVAAAGLAVGPGGGTSGKGYVPDSPDVLFATGMVQADQSESLTFTAPDEPGEYPYVCTFPQHWSRMYGVMVVVEDLDAWLADPVEPTDPIGSNRSFVATWTVDDLKPDLVDGLRGRSAEIGKKIFVEASCGTCHKYDGQGGAVGPELTDVFIKWKDDREAILREILDPSACIDEKYAMHTVLTVDGQTISGLIQAETDEAVTLIADPESGKPTVIPQDDVEEFVKMKTSMMPKGLLNQYTKDEILELMAFLRGQPNPKGQPISKGP